MEPQPAQLGPYSLGRTLGEGTSGKVKLAVQTETNRQCAIKVICRRAFDQNPSLQGKIQREIALMRLVEHPHILKLMDVLESPRHLYIVLEFASRGELFDYLVSRGTLSDDEAT